MNRIEVTSIEDYISKTNEAEFIFDTHLYRGQVVQGNLLPSVARMAPSQDTTKKEKETLAQLSLMGVALLPHAGMTPLELMVLGQHYGLKTRLLDWTTNPLVAAYFACADSKQGDAYVYILEADLFMNIGLHVPSVDPFAEPRTSVYQPKWNNQRIVAQDGWFTLHPFSKKSGGFVPLEKNEETTGFLTEVRIPEEKRVDLLKGIRRLGITSRTIYPDLNGLCLHLNVKNGLE